MTRILLLIICVITFSSNHSYSASKASYFSKYQEILRHPKNIEFLRVMLEESVKKVGRSQNASLQFFATDAILNSMSVTPLAGETDTYLVHFVWQCRFKERKSPPSSCAIDFVVTHSRNETYGDTNVWRLVRLKIEGLEWPGNRGVSFYHEFTLNQE